LVLHPAYPRILLDKKLYLAGGVAAAFECKTTLKAEHIKNTVKTSAEIRKNLPKQLGTPYKELNSSIIYGLLAHSHSWKNKNSKPIENVEKALWEADYEYIDHPIQCLDFISVSDLATWQSHKTTYISPKLPFYKGEIEKKFGKDGYATSSYVCASINSERQKEYFSPIGVLLSGLFSKLAWTYKDMQGLESYFRKVNLMGSGVGNMRIWPIQIYSDQIKERVYNGQLSNGSPYDEWHIHF